MCNCRELLHRCLAFNIEGTRLRTLPGDLIRVYIAPMVAAPPPAIERCRVPNYKPIDRLSHSPDIPKPYRPSENYWRRLHMWTRLDITFVASPQVCTAYRVTASGYKKIASHESPHEYGACWFPCGMFISSSHNEYIVFDGDMFIPVDLPQLTRTGTRTVVDTICGTLDVRDAGSTRIWNMNVNPPTSAEGRCCKAAGFYPVVFFA